jgi:putative ABC transport system ATP-binding protein
MPGKERTVIELSNVSKTYQTGEVTVTALRNVSMKVKRGEFVVIMGPSGSGKSTLMNLIGCLDVPTDGKIFLEGHDISKFTESHLARIRGSKIGFIFQFFNLYPTLSVLENVELPMRIHNYDEREIRKRSLDLLRMVSLENRNDHLPSQLSGGEMQRVAIARALTTDPSMILADEPTGNIDSKTAKEIMGFFTALHRERDETIIIVTHDESISRYAQRVIHLKDGQIREGGG